jgi:anthranilate phosphoribosyltransferase
MKRIQPIRKAIGIRTIFNLIGPLANPARVERQLIGIARPDYVSVYGKALQSLRTKAALVVSGEEGLDELSGAGPSRIFNIGGLPVGDAVTPGDAGLASAATSAIHGGDAAYNAAALRRLLQGETGPYRDAVLLNAAAALIVAGRADNWLDGVEEAAEVLDNGLANTLLDCWIAF